MQFVYILVIMLMLVLTGCDSRMEKEEISSPKMMEKIGKGPLETIAQANHVRFIMAENQPKLLSAQETKTLQDLLLNDKGYIFDRHKKCLFIPELAFQFGGKNELTITVSTLCKQIKFSDSKQTVVLDYDPMDEQFTQFCQFISHNN